MKLAMDPAQPLMRRLLRLLRLRVWIAEKLQPTEWQAMLGWAALAGFLGAIMALGFRTATEGIHQMLTGSSQGVVESFRLIPWWARLIVPAMGGVLAGLGLLFGRRLTKAQSSTDYMEAIVIGSGRVPLRASIVKSTAALFSIGSGGSIGREGPMVPIGRGDRVIYRAVAAVFRRRNSACWWPAVRRRESPPPIMRRSRARFSWRKSFSARSQWKAWDRSSRPR